MSLYKNRYRVESVRLKKYNYASNGYYFFTICTNNRNHLFGKIMDGKMQLSEYGKIVQREWSKSFEIRSELSCDCYVIMPNHIHAIVVINNPPVDSRGSASLPVLCHKSHGIAYRSPRSISSFIACFKSVVTKQINVYRNSSGYKVFQSGFYDHIIREKEACNRIRKYIKNNPIKWELKNK